MLPQANLTIMTGACEECDGARARAVAWEEVPKVPLANRCGCVSECVSAMLLQIRDLLAGRTQAKRSYTGSATFQGSWS